LGLDGVAQSEAKTIRGYDETLDLIGDVSTDSKRKGSKLRTKLGGGSGISARRKGGKKGRATQRTI